MSVAEKFDKADYVFTRRFETNDPVMVLNSEDILESGWVVGTQLDDGRISIFRMEGGEMVSGEPVSAQDLTRWNTPAFIEAKKASGKFSEGSDTASE